jgi:hypothetical protein
MAAAEANSLKTLNRCDALRCGRAHPAEPRRGEIGGRANTLICLPIRNRLRRRLDHADSRAGIGCACVIGGCSFADAFGLDGVDVAVVVASQASSAWNSPAAPLLAAGSSCLILRISAYFEALHLIFKTFSGIVTLRRDYT